MLSYREAIRDALFALMDSCEDVILYGIGVGDHTAAFGTLSGLKEKYPNRLIDTPLCEDSLVGLGMGMALAGLRPINVHIRADFLLLAMNQIANMVASYRQFTPGVRLPLTIRVVVGRGWGQGWHHSKAMFSSFAHIPGLTVAVPVTPADAKYMLLDAVRGSEPTIIFEHRWLYYGEGEDVRLSIQKQALQLEHYSGAKDVRFVAVGRMVQEAAHAAEHLKSSGIDAGVVDVRYLSPLDREALAREAGIGSKVQCENVIVCDGDWMSYGAGAELLASLYDQAMQCGQRVNFARIGWNDEHIPTSLRGEERVYKNEKDLLFKAGEMLSLPRKEIEEIVSYVRPISHNHPFRGPF